jgi:hypothetical protein
MDLSEKEVIAAARLSLGDAPVRGERVRWVHELLQDSGPPLDLHTGRRSR